MRKCAELSAGMWQSNHMSHFPVQSIPVILGWRLISSYSPSQGVSNLGPAIARNPTGPGKHGRERVEE